MGDPVNREAKLMAGAEYSSAPLVNLDFDITEHPTRVSGANHIAARIGKPRRPAAGGRPAEW